MMLKKKKLDNRISLIYDSNIIQTLNNDIKKTNEHYKNEINHNTVILYDIIHNSSQLLDDHLFSFILLNIMYIYTRNVLN